jgi:SAM-dependent methyltransferase
VDDWIDGRTAGVSSAVRNVLGDGCVRIVAGDDTVTARVAAWAVRHSGELEAALRALRKHPGQQRRSDLPFADELQRHAWITGDSAPRLTEDGMLALEVLNRHVAGDRTAETRRFLHEHAVLDSTSSVLDVGCSSGFLLRSLADRRPRRRVGVDADLFALHIAALGSGDDERWCCASATDLPFPDGAFTHVLSFITLNYVPVREALREMARVLTDGGQLILTIEGHGFWLRQLQRSRARRQLNLLARELPGNLALPLCDWQRYAALRRVSPHVTLSRRAIARLLAEAGIEVERSKVLLEERGVPWLIGVTARRRRRR